PGPSSPRCHRDRDRSRAGPARFRARASCRHGRRLPPRARGVRRRRPGPEGLTGGGRRAPVARPPVGRCRLAAYARPGVVRVVCRTLARGDFCNQVLEGPYGCGGGGGGGCVMVVRGAHTLL